MKLTICIYIHTHIYVYTHMCLSTLKSRASNGNKENTFLCSVDFIDSLERHIIFFNGIFM